MNINNKKKTDQLGMPVGTASSRLRKMIIFDYAQKCGHDNCYQCGEKISDIENFSIEHKVPYLDSNDPKFLFFDLNNIAFSHLSCNIGAGRKQKHAHPSHSAYVQGCRCDECKNVQKLNRRKYRENKKTQ